MRYNLGIMNLMKRQREIYISGGERINGGKQDGN